MKCNYGSIDKLCFPHVSCAEALKSYIADMRKTEESEYHDRFLISVDFMMDCGLVNRPNGQAIKAVGNAVWDDVMGYGI